MTSSPARRLRVVVPRNPASSQAAHQAVKQVSRRSRYGLFLANFLLAELVGVLIPLLNDYLLSKGWRYDAIGLATALSGLGLLLAQIPVGALLDHVSHYRRILMLAALAVGACFGVLPALAAHPVLLDSLMFLGGVGQAFIVPLLGTLALALAGRHGVNELMGDSQAWNHAGNIATSFGVLLLVRAFGMQWAFFAVTGISVCAAASCLIVRGDELRPPRRKSRRTPWAALLRDPRVRWLLGCSALFHLANAAITPMVAMYARTLRGPEGFVTVLVLAAQITMTAAAWAAGRLGDSLGRKPVMALAFMVLPLRIVLYALITHPHGFILVAVLDGTAVGLYNVIVASVCADVDEDRGHFNTLLSLAFGTLALGNVISPLVGGLLVQHVGFKPAFYLFASVAACAAGLFLFGMPETRPAPPSSS